MNKPAKIQAETLPMAMALAFGEIEAATKSAENEAFKRGGKASTYANLEAVIAAIKPPLIKHGLFFTQRPEPSEHGVTIETMLHHASGEEMSLGKLFVPAMKDNAHGYGSALTYARRYALVTAFGVPVEDDDGNAAAAAPPKKEKHSKLKTQVRELVREIHSVGDWDTWVGFRETDSFQTVTMDCREKLPGWWEGWDEQPDGFTPLSKLIQQKEQEFAKEKASYANA